MAVTSRSASYHASSSSPFDHATGGFFAPKDIEQWYVLPAGAHPGRLRFTDDLESNLDRLAEANGSGGSSPLYRSCSSGSDDTPAGPSGGFGGTAGNGYSMPSEMQQLVSSSGHLVADSTAAGESLALQTIRTSRDDRVFWVPEHGDDQLAFTEYTKQQMGSTLGPPAAAAVHGPGPYSMPAASLSRQRHGGVHAPSGHALTTPLAEAHKIAVHQSAHAWTSPQEVDEAPVGGTSSSWAGSFSAEERPHPPDVPSSHFGVLHAVSGFRGGRRGDPRLRRFKDASDSAATEYPLTNAVVSSRAMLPRQEANGQQQLETRPGPLVSDYWSGRPQAVDMLPGVGPAVDVKSVEAQLIDVEALEPQGKQYWRAPPSLAWGTLPVSQSNSAGNVT